MSPTPEDQRIARAAVTALARGAVHELGNLLTAVHNAATLLSPAGGGDAGGLDRGDPGTVEIRDLLEQSARSAADLTRDLGRLLRPPSDESVRSRAERLARLAAHAYPGFASLEVRADVVPELGTGVELEEDLALLFLAAAPPGQAPARARLEFSDAAERGADLAGSGRLRIVLEVDAPPPPAGDAAFCDAPTRRDALRSLQVLCGARGLAVEQAAGTTTRYAIAPKAPHTAGAPSGARTALVIEPDPGVRATAAKMLERLGFAVVTARDATTVNAALTTLKETPPEVVLLDEFHFALAALVAKTAPEARIVISAAVDGAPPEPAHAVLLKPYGLGDLRDALGRPGGN